jgi:hypothetical protein
MKKQKKMGGKIILSSATVMFALNKAQMLESISSKVLF